MGNKLFCPPPEKISQQSHESNGTQSSFTSQQSAESYNYNLQMKYCFFKLLQHRDWASVQSAIQSNPILAAQRDSLGCTTLHMTCSLHPTFEILSTIYQKFPNAIKMKDGQGRLPLHVAVMYGADMEILQALISYFPEALMKKDGKGQLPLHHLLLLNTTPGNQHPNATPSSRYEYHSTFPIDLLLLLMPLKETKILHRFSESMKSDIDSKKDVKPLIVTHKDVHGYTPLTLCWESYRSVIPWNEEEYEERRRTEWKKLEVLLLMSYYGMPHPNRAHVIEKTNDIGTYSHRRVHRQFFSRGIGMGSSISPFSINPSNGKRKLLHAAVGIGGEYWCPHELFFLLLEKHPEQIFDVNEDGNLPLMMALDPRISTQDTLDDFNSHHQNQSHSSRMRPSFQDALVTNHDAQKKILISDSAAFHPFSNVFIKPLILHHPAAAQIPHTKTHQLPLHVALHNQRGWLEGVEDLFHAYPEALCIPDPISGLLPFCIPSISWNQNCKSKTSCTVKKDRKSSINPDSCEEKCCVETIYLLLKADPSVI